MSNRTLEPITYAEAIAILRKPGRKLIVTHLRTGPEYCTSPEGRRIAPITAERLIRRCCATDAGLFPGIPQAWRWGR
jgi:hypothetical protein